MNLCKSEETGQGADSETGGSKRKCAENQDESGISLGSCRLE